MRAEVRVRVRVTLTLTFNPNPNQDDETAALEQHRRTVGRTIMRNKMRMRELEETREMRRQDLVRRNLAKSRALEEAQLELEG